MRSQRAWIRLSAPCDLIVSMPVSASTSVELRMALARYVVSASACSFFCTSQPYVSVAPMATTTGISSHGEIHAITTRNSSRTAGR